MADSAAEEYAFTVYSDYSSRFRLSVPSGWEVTRVAGALEASADATAARWTAPVVQAFARDRPASWDVEDLVKLAVRQVEAGQVAHTSWAVHEQHRTELGPYEAVRLDLTQTIKLPRSSTVARMLKYFVVAEREYAIITAAVPPAQFSAKWPLLEQIAQSFRFEADRLA